MKKLITILALILCLTALFSCGDKSGEKVYTQIEMESGGVITLELYSNVAPITVANFKKLAEQGVYDGTIFHRVIPGFMIQGGGFDANFDQKEAKSIKGEFRANGVKNDLKHERGVLSMARTSAPNSASSQFFIMHARAPHLDGQYAAFGKVYEGLEVVDKIANVPTTVKMWMYQDCPRKDVVITTIEEITQ